MNSLKICSFSHIFSHINTFKQHFISEDIQKMCGNNLQWVEYLGTGHGGMVAPTSHHGPMIHSNYFKGPPGASWEGWPYMSYMPLRTRYHYAFLHVPYKQTVGRDFFVPMAP